MTPTKTVLLDGSSLTVNQVVQVSRDYLRVEIVQSAIDNVRKGRSAVDRILKSGKTVYGINTGFGKLSDSKMKDIDQLQSNLIRSHSTGTGTPLGEDEVRAVMVVRLNSLLHGNSGVRVQVIRILQEFLNKQVYPSIPRYGSLGASGDLAPSAHLGLCMMGEGYAFDRNGKKKETMKILNSLKIEPIKFKTKEGLAIVNGTQVMTGLGCLVISDAFSLLRNLDIAAAMTLEALGGSLSPFDTRVQKLRPMHGQGHVAARILRLVRDSGLTGSTDRIQDAYSIRCIPQVHGAFYDVFQYVRSVLEIEINSVTDNPLVFWEKDEVVNAGNFHGQPVSLALDHACTAIVEASVYSERRIDKLLSGYNPKLPLFLSEHAGLNSGLMVTQYTAAALVAENRVIGRPASLESASVSAGQEDHASMGVTAALKARNALEFTAKVIAIEVLCAAQALDFLIHTDSKLGQGTRIAYQEVRNMVKTVDKDRPLNEDIERLTHALKDDKLTKEIEKTVQL
jgi:histidine ammonia-lyase